MLGVIIAVTVAGIYIWLRVVFDTCNLKPDIARLVKHAQQLGLKKKEIRLLRQVRTAPDDCDFYRLDFCVRETLKMFIEAVKKPHGASVSNIFDFCKHTVKSEYNTCPAPENEVVYLKENIPVALQEHILGISRALPPLTREQEKMLYNCDASRWKRTFNGLTDHYHPEHTQQFYRDILEIAAMNEASEARQRSIYYKGYNFLAGKDNKFSAMLYIHYLHTSLGTFKHKDIGKKNRKLLFDKEKEYEFDCICKRLSSGDPGKALRAVEELYRVKRKKIRLDSVKIAEAGTEHAAVVDILDRYLSEEDAPSLSPGLSKTETPHKNTINRQNIIHRELLRIFGENSLQLSREVFDDFVREKGVFKNQLIESINEMYYELLDDVLIEESEEAYTIDKGYFEQIKTS